MDPEQHKDTRIVHVSDLAHKHNPAVVKAAAQEAGLPPEALRVQGVSHDMVPRFLAAADVSKAKGGCPVSIEAVLKEAAKKVEAKLAK